MVRINFVTLLYCIQINSMESAFFNFPSPHGKKFSMKINPIGRKFDLTFSTKSNWIADRTQMGIQMWFFWEIFKLLKWYDGGQGGHLKFEWSLQVRRTEKLLSTTDFYLSKPTVLSIIQKKFILTLCKRLSKHK